jgi:hypothetical protein
MDLEAVSTEIRTALGTITGLRTPPWGVEQVQAPAAIVALPERVSFDETYGRGKDMYPDLPVVVLVGAPEDRASRKSLAAYAAGSGAKSVKAVLEAYAWTTCDNVTVESCEFNAGATFNAVPYLAAIFHLKIIGRGA